MQQADRAAEYMERRPAEPERLSPIRRVFPRRFRRENAIRRQYPRGDSVARMELGCPTDFRCQRTFHDWTHRDAITRGHNLGRTGVDGDAGDERTSTSAAPAHDVRSC